MVSIEVFKTNIACEKDCSRLHESIAEQFPGYQVNFDLNDCDRVMRVVSPYGEIEVPALTILARKVGFYIEPLPDQVSP